MDPHPNQHQLYVIGHCPKTNYIILSSAPLVKSLLPLVTPPRNQRQRFETEKEKATKGLNFRAPTEANDPQLAQRSPVLLALQTSAAFAVR